MHHTQSMGDGTTIWCDRSGDAVNVVTGAHNRNILKTIWYFSKVLTFAFANAGHAIWHCTKLNDALTSGSWSHPEMCSASNVLILGAKNSNEYQYSFYLVLPRRFPENKRLPGVLRRGTSWKSSRHTWMHLNRKRSCGERNFLHDACACL